jgi:hypothetical protein
MKVVITENRLFNSIYKYIDETFNPKEMDWVYSPGVDEDGFEDIDLDNENFLIFFKGDWEGEYDSDVVFHYFDLDFYDENDVAQKSFREKAPVLEVMGEYGENLDTMFGNHWHESMKKWFQDNFNLPVKTLSTYYNYENR